MKWRFCVQVHVLNNVTCQAAYPLPRIGESLDALCGNKYFRTLDILADTCRCLQVLEKSDFITKKWPL